jgi:ATP-dependent DNA helicase RecG
LVHGALDASLRQERLAAFRAGESRILVGTTVIEVGVDVPQATVLVVEGAEHLGLAQLHQLRGRVGRGSGDSWCLLFGKESAAERFELLEGTNDGFEIAEEDLRRRGMGDLDGLRQSGGGIDPEEDLDLLLAARDVVATHPALVEAYLAEEALNAKELSP